MSARFFRPVQLLETLRHPEVCDRIIRLPDQCLLVAVERRPIVLPFEVEISDLNVLHRFVRIPWVEFLHVGRHLSVSIRNSRTAVGMILGIVFGRAEVNPAIAAGTFPCFFVPLRSGRLLVLTGYWLLLSDTQPAETYRQYQQRYET